jgi:hypothetical protein
MFHHDIHFAHTRHPLTASMGDADTSSAISISVDSADLVEALSELLSRLPNDLYAALKSALGMVER